MLIVADGGGKTSTLRRGISSIVPTRPVVVARTYVVAPAFVNATGEERAPEERAKRIPIGASIVEMEQEKKRAGWRSLKSTRGRLPASSARPADRRHANLTSEMWVEIAWFILTRCISE